MPQVPGDERRAERDREPALSWSSAGRPSRYLDAYYHRILVATDRKVFDFAAQYNLGPAIREKTVHTGYVADGVPHDTVKTVREDRGLKDGDLWVVASAERRPARRAADRGLSGARPRVPGRHLRHRPGAPVEHRLAAAAPRPRRNRQPAPPQGDP
ncbi:hypothetical protein ACFSTC_10230 [Nonomuraea ferruginea]